MRARARQLAAAILAGFTTGCMLPVYHLPAGYSSTYHEHLRAETRVIEVGRVLIDNGAVGLPSPSQSYSAADEQTYETFGPATEIPADLAE